MKRIANGFCAAATFGLVATLSAQTPQTSPTGTTGTAGTTAEIADQRSSSRDMNKEVTVTGCLARDPHGMFTLNNAMIETSPSTSTTTGTTSSTSTSSTTTSTTANTTTTADSRRTDKTAAAWQLDGSTAELEKHVGHKIQVSGSVANSGGTTGGNPTASTSTATGTSGTATGSTASMEHKLNVKSVKMLSSSCS